MLEFFNGTRYLVLFSPEKYDAIYNRIKYIISQKSGIPYIFSHYYMKIKVESYDSFASRKNIDFTCYNNY